MTVTRLLLGCLWYTYRYAMHVTQPISKDKKMYSDTHLTVP